MTEKHTDRWLLEMAARAYGLDDYVWDRTGYGMVAYAGGAPAWNPLQDDADAFGLAVKLEMNVFQAAGSAYALPSDDDGTYEKQVRYSDAGGDPIAATRRAIVRAAAAIGEAMGRQDA